MKTFCVACDIHFIDEFEKTLLPPCNYWGDMGMSNLDVELKKKVWDWLFSLPADEIGIKASLGIGVEIRAVPISNEDTFEAIVPGYVDMNEEEKKKAQKVYFRMKRNNHDITNLTDRKKKTEVN